MVTIASVMFAVGAHFHGGTSWRQVGHRQSGQLHRSVRKVFFGSVFCLIIIIVADYLLTFALDEFADHIPEIFKFPDAELPIPYTELLITATPGYKKAVKGVQWPHLGIVWDPQIGRQPLERQIEVWRLPMRLSYSVV